MFSDSISKLMGQSGIDAAKERSQQIENMLIQYTVNAKNIQLPSSKETTASEFSELMKSGANPDIKFRIVPPAPAVSKGYIESLVKKISQKYDLDNRLVLAIIKQESNFNPNAISSAGAQGLMQLMPSTARGLGISNPFDPEQNLEGGIKHIKNLLNKYNGNLVLALAAYNAGSGSISKYGGIPPFAETQNYVKKILANYLDKNGVIDAG